MPLLCYPLLAGECRSLLADEMVQFLTATDIRWDCVPEKLAHCITPVPPIAVDGLGLFVQASLHGYRRQTQLSSLSISRVPPELPMPPRIGPSLLGPRAGGKMRVFKRAIRRSHCHRGIPRR